MLAFNDNGPLLLSDYFGAGGAGADLTLYVQTTAGVGSLPVSTTTSAEAAGDNFIRFGPFGADLDALVDNIEDGHQVHPRLRAPGRPPRSRCAARRPPARPRPPPRWRASRARPSAPALFGPAGCADASGARRSPRHRPGRPAITRIGHLQLHGLAASGAPALFAHVARVPPAAEQYARTIRESAPERRLLTALEIRHAAVAAPVRVVNDTEERTIEGNRYVALRFDARLADDAEGQAPQAELAIDNVGRDLTQWLEAAQGGTGATVRVLQVLDIDDPPIEWELTMDVAGVQVDAERVTARLGFDPLLGRAAVTLRHDPQTSPGLF